MTLTDTAERPPRRERVVTRADARTGPRGNPKLRDRALMFGSPLLLLVLWEIGTRSGLFDERFFPAPTAIFAQMATMTGSGELWLHTAASMQRFAIGFVLGVVPALAIGIVMGLNRSVRAALTPLVSGTYPIPKSALLPLILLIFGLGESSKVVMVAIGVFYPVVLNTISGVLQIQPIHYDVAKNYRASRWRMFRTVALPGAMPSIMTGVELGAGLGLILIALAEMIGADSGLGFMIWNSWELFMVESMYVGILVIAVIGFVVAMLIRELSRVLMPWSDR
jgi:ABC-type nitrate/sulfonate/bicarbonate transport system permease component